MIITAYSIPIWITAILITSLATVTYWGSNKRSSHTFAIAMYAVAVYTAAGAFFLFQNDYKIEAVGIKFMFFVSMLIPALIYIFIKAFADEKRPGGWMIFWSLVVVGGAFYLNFFTDYIAGAPIALSGIASGVFWGWKYGPYSLLLYIFSLTFYLAGVVILVKLFKNNPDHSFRANILLNLAGLFIGVSSPMICNTILPQLGNYDWVWFGQTSSIIWVSIIAYSILRYNKMSIKIVVTEVLVIGMAIAAFTNIFIGDFLGMSGKIAIFLAFSILGVYLIRSAITESAQKEQLADLNRHLQQKIEDQTKEIRASYQVERNARLELEKVDEAKNQFILITQHHLRTPITSIKWQLEAIMSDTYGSISPGLKKAMSDMGESVSRLNHLIDSLLSISALRSGIETLTKTSIGIKDIVEDIVTELKKDIDRKHLVVSMPAPKEVWTPVSIDKDRMREALFIVIENAVRYNVDNGSISITGHPTENTFELTVENTGAELSSDDKKKIFSELFYRSSQAQTSHPTGMGIGLSMAQAIIEAHKGTISLSSRKDNGGGVRVVVTLPY